jgi:nuclear pore complex protein Nup210
MSDLYRISVEVANKVQVGAAIVAIVKVMDSSGRSFPASQFKHMNLVPYLKTAHIDVKPASADTLKSFSEAQLWDSAIFDVEGVSVGTTNLYFNATRRGGGVVTSSPNEIQVFSALTLSPKEIWLVPGAIFQVHSSGGPSQADIIFSINDSFIASVDDSGLVRAKSVGDAMVTGKAEAEDGISGKLHIFTEDVVYVHVRKLTGVRISIPSNKLLAGNEVAVRAHGVLSDDTPFEFGSSVPRISFTWSVINMDSLTLVSVYEKSGVALDEEKDFAARLHTRNPGVGEIQLEAKCPPGVCTPDEATFQDRVQVQVLSKLILKSPQDGYFLLPQYSSARIETNRDGIARMSYQLLAPEATDPNLIVLSSLGQVTTAGINGHAVVMVTSFESESSFNQSVSVHVEVCPVFSMALTPPPSLPQATPNSKYHSFPLGYSAEFTADLHDNKGRKFSRSAISTKYRLNRNDIVRVLPGNNGSLMIQASQQGEAILRVWLRDHTHIDDYIRVRVGFAVTPNMATVHLGTLICFSTHLALEGYPGSWSSGDEGILKIVDSGGVGKAVSPGKTVVYHSVPDVIDTRTEIYVERLSEVIVDRQFVRGQSPFTNAPNTSTFTIPLTFTKSDGKPFTPINVASQKPCLRALQIKEEDFSPKRLIQQVAFDCVMTMTSSQRRGNMDASRYITASPYFDMLTGSSSCLLTASGDLSTASDIASQDGLKLSVNVVAHDNDRTHSVESGPVEVEFIPAFTLSPSHVILTSPKDTVTLTISGITKQLQKLQVTSSDPTWLEVSKASSSAQDSHAYATRVMGKVPSKDASAHVRVYSSLTQQTVLVPVNYHPVVMTTDACPANESPLTKDTPPIKMAASHAPKTESRDEGYSFLIPVLIAFTVGAVGVILAFLAYGRSRKTGSQSGFKDHIPKSSSPQTLSPVVTPKMGSPNSSLMSQTGFGGTPMVSMTTPTSGAFKGISPQSIKQATPTSVMSRGVSPSTKYRSLYSQ